MTPTDMLTERSPPQKITMAREYTGTLITSGVGKVHVRSDRLNLSGLQLMCSDNLHYTGVKLRPGMIILIKHHCVPSIHNLPIHSPGIKERSTILSFSEGSEVLQDFLTRNVGRI